eukprot:1177246-Prorocentrum_minimum.AAC.4
MEMTLGAVLTNREHAVCGHEMASNTYTCTKYPEMLTVMYTRVGINLITLSHSPLSIVFGSGSLGADFP